MKAKRKPLDFLVLFLNMAWVETVEASVNFDDYNCLWGSEETMCNISTSCNVDSNIDQFFQPVLYIIVIVLGLPTNCMALWAAYMQVRQKNELGVYLMNLSVADLLYIATLPLWIDYFVHHDNWIHGQVSCKLFGFIFYTNIYCQHRLPLLHICGSLLGSGSSPEIR